MPTRSHGLVEILDRVLDKGLVIAGDIKINLANVELLTIQVRLLVCSIDKAEQIGLNWWRHDPRLSSVVTPPYAVDPAAVEERLERIERRLEALTPTVRPPRAGHKPSSTE
ncbi:MAG TPA: gas vesicle protein [Gemmatimonadaceae bacterium]